MTKQTVNFIGHAALAVLMAFSATFSVANETGKIPKIGQVWLSNPATAKPFDEAFRAGLRDAGYTEGKNILILPRYAEGDSARLPGLISELIALRVDVLLVSPAAMLNAKEATQTIPIVCATMGDPVERGLVASLAHPGGNLTGMANQRLDTDPKRLQLVKEIVPGLNQLGLIFTPYPNAKAHVEDFRALARATGVTLQTYEVGNPKELDAALKAIDAKRPQAMIVWSSAFLTLHRQVIFDVSLHHIPMISDAREYAEAGALLTYAPSGYEMYKHSAVHVDKILKGAKPADVPIEQPTKFELVVNLKTAKALGLTMPQAVLVRADEVIQ